MPWCTYILNFMSLSSEMAEISRKNVKPHHLTPWPWDLTLTKKIKFTDTVFSPDIKNIKDFIRAFTVGKIHHTTFVAKAVLNIKTCLWRHCDVNIGCKSKVIFGLSDPKSFGLSDPKSIRINVKIFKNNSTSAFDLFDLWPCWEIDVETKNWYFCAQWDGAHPFQT